jgi:hypothetical protein
MCKAVSQTPRRTASSFQDNAARLDMRLPPALKAVLAMLAHIRRTFSGRRGQFTRSFKCARRSCTPTSGFIR